MAKSPAELRKQRIPTRTIASRADKSIGELGCVHANSVEIVGVQAQLNPVRTASVRDRESRHFAAWTNRRSRLASGRRRHENFMNDAAWPALQIETHRDILRLNSLDPLAYIAIIDIASINLHKIMKGGTFVSGSLVSASEFVVQGHAGFAIKRWKR